MLGSNRRHYWLAVALIAAVPAGASAQLSKPGTGPATGPAVPAPAPTPAASTPEEAALQAPVADQGPIVPDTEFEQALPPLSNDINAPLEAMPSTAPAPSSTQTSASVAPGSAASTAAATPIGDALPPVAAETPEMTQPLTPLASFNATPLDTTADQQARQTTTIHYDTDVKGLDKVALEAPFNSLSALKKGGGKAENATQVQARARQDEDLAVRLMKSLGYYDGTAVSTIDLVPNQPGQLKVTVSATPGKLYTLGSVTVDAQPTTPADLVRHELPLHTGDPIAAARIEGAEANVSLTLPQQGYPFVKVGQRDILLDGQTFKGDYTLPVDTGPRSSFGVVRTKGDDVFGLKHLNVFPRFDQGDLYDIRKVDDLRDALTATGLFSSISVVPVQTGTVLPDGTEQVDLMVDQVKGPARAFGGSAGYSTGEGIKVEGSWTSRNLFPPEGALILTGTAGTQEQGASATFRRSNAGKRDRTFSMIASADHSAYDAFDALTTTLAVRWSYDSTPIWQKKFTYAYGAELVGTNESVYDFAAGDRERRTYGIAALPLQAGFDTSDDLLNPTKGYRLKLSLSPETSVQGSVSPYARTMIEGSYYYRASASIVLAGRLRAGSIFGIDRDDLAPSRRYYGGGGGSVRGYGYQRLGPLDPNGDPVGGRSLNEFSLEARYRFGNFGIVPFLDGGNAYESMFPQGSDLRYGAGIGGRFYTNFGPFRVDLATPLNPRKGDSKLALYISIGQAF